MTDTKNRFERGDDRRLPDAAPAATAAIVGDAAVSIDGGATLGPTTPPAESGRQADSLLTPDVTGGSEGFANTPGGTLLAPDVAPDEVDPNAGT